VAVFSSSPAATLLSGTWLQCRHISLLYSFWARFVSVFLQWRRAEISAVRQGSNGGHSESRNFHKQVRNLNCCTGLQRFVSSLNFSYRSSFRLITTLWLGDPKTGLLPPFPQTLLISMKFGRVMLVHCGFNLTQIGAWAAPGQTLRTSFFCNTWNVP